MVISFPSSSHAHLKLHFVDDFSFSKVKKTARKKDDFVLTATEEESTESGR